jgi:hypothetical protein
MTNEYSKENPTGRSIIVVLAVMADNSELSLASGPFSYTSGAQISWRYIPT